MQCVPVNQPKHPKNGKGRVDNGAQKAAEAPNYPQRG